MLIAAPPHRIGRFILFFLACSTKNCICFEVETNNADKPIASGLTSSILSKNFCNGTCLPKSYTIFQNNGYTVYDLGKQVPLQKFLDKIDEVNPDAIGLSALLVSTSKQMQFFVEHARKNKMNLPILCGGAAINTNYINRIAKQDGIYEPGVF